MARAGAIALLADPRDDRDASSCAILRHLDDYLRDDDQVVLAAVRPPGLYNWTSLQFASERLRSSPNFMLEAVRVSRSDEIIKYAMGAAKADADVNLAALERSRGVAIDWLVAPLNDDRNFMLRAVRVTPYALVCASDRLLVDEAFMAGIANVPNIDWPLDHPRLRGVELRALLMNHPLARRAIDLGHRLGRAERAQELREARAALADAQNELQDARAALRGHRREGAAMEEPARRRQRVV